jgi:hypothetical protein
MTKLGSRKVDRTGRSTGPYKVYKRLKIGANFVPHIVDMVESPAWRTMSLSARRVLDRIEIEHLHHGLAENGRLPVTFDDFVSYGIERHGIAAAIRECEALGFIEITQRGRAGNADFRRPNVFRLTYLPTYRTGENATNEWSRIETREAAEMLARNARNSGIKKQKTSAGKPTNTSAGKPTTKPQFHGGETRTTPIVGKPALLSISPGDEPVRKEWSTPLLIELSDTMRH